MLKYAKINKKKHKRTQFCMARASKGDILYFKTIKLRMYNKFTVKTKPDILDHLNPPPYLGIHYLKYAYIVTDPA